MNDRMPVLFVGHGSPLYAIQDNEWSRAFRGLPPLIPRPHTVLMISAHWYTSRTFVTGNDRPPTIHDFYGFPSELYEVHYLASGDATLAKRVRDLLGGDADLNSEWGLDHGAWSVLRWMYPKADVPVIQLSINGNLMVSEHLELAQSLRPLRDEGVLIMGSGNVTHNLRDLMMRMQREDTVVPDWARNFDERLKEILENRDTQALVGLWPASEDARRAHPTPDHFLPIVYAYGATDSQDTVQFPIEGFDHSVSMRACLWGKMGS
jgi:4,5-DOPA dioxygenase extradiol